jgi:Family of unknown function (DUF6172)
MRKTFPLSGGRHKPPQALAAVKNEVRKYLKRERGKTLPEGMDFWDFDCKFGKEAATEVTHVADLLAAIDAAAAQGWETVHVEILARARARQRKPGVETTED